ncbi:potassium channel family protein [Yinghuangia seranimata]|uniref:potassium channel family protein n=1 Tax=Yinghuangia seranimata TaxID=408067 RepID=UPI00248BE9BE|nr:potassium channel family protein [Yinghuangia seranimata]MDI2127724.1 ion channel [Yinghuangia seranimata]
MTAGAGTGTAGKALAQQRPSSSRLTWSVVRVTLSVAALVALYYVLPFDRASQPTVVTTLLIGLAGFVVLVVFQVRAIIQASHPLLRAVEALSTCVPFFLLLFAATYVALAALSPASFGEPLSHSDAVYFTVTVFSTVGFGDITAKTETARLVVTVQMIADLIILGLAVKVIVEAVRRGRLPRTDTGDSTGRGVADNVGGDGTAAGDDTDAGDDGAGP